MSGIYWQPTAIDSWTQVIFGGIVLVYLLLSMPKREDFWWFFFALFGFYYYFSLADLLRKVLLYVPWSFALLTVKELFPMLTFIALVVFAYQFEERILKNRWELSLVVGLLVLLELQVVLVIFDIIPGEPIYYYISFLPLIWAQFVLLRKYVIACRHAGDVRSNWIMLLHPQVPSAQAYRSFGLVLLIPTVLSIVHLLRMIFISQGALASFSFFLAQLLMFAGLALTYINYAPRTTSFQVKLVGISLVVLLTILSLTGYVVEPILIDFAASQPDSTLPDRAGIRFVPLQPSGYQVMPVEYQSLDTLGKPLALGDDKSAIVELDFPFTFYNQTWQRLFVSDNGVVVFDAPLDVYRLGSGLQAAIFPRLIDLIPANNDISQVYVLRTENRLVITWYQLAAMGREHQNTFRLEMYPDHSFNFYYLDTEPAWRDYALQTPFQSTWQVGISSGNMESPPGYFQINNLPETGVELSGAILADNTYTNYRQILHQKMLPLVIMILVSTILVLVLVPLFLRSSLVKPLDRLLHGVRRVNDGDMLVTLPVTRNDEIGFLSKSFNDMVDSVYRAHIQLEEINQSLEQRVAERTAELHQKNQQLQEVAIRDPLTKIYNRRYFFELAEKEMAHALRYHRPLSLILMDADFFKQVNDKFGHVVGDQVLIHLAKLCQNNIRSTDTCARYGGEEFIIIMPETDGNVAFKSAERLRELVAAKPLELDNSIVSIKISLGVASLTDKHLPFNVLVDHADQALYHSKHNGRNQTSMWDDSLAASIEDCRK